MWFAATGGRRQILCEHYEKEIATKAVINAKSAIPAQTKRTVMSQDMLRILLHCSDQLPWDTVCKHLNKFMKKLQYSGYTQPFRYHVMQSAMKAYEKIKQKSELGIRTVNRLRSWRQDEREKENEEDEETGMVQRGGL